MGHTCATCLKTFSSSYSLSRHALKKIPCHPPGGPVAAPATNPSVLEEIRAQSALIQAELASLRSCIQEKRTPIHITNNINIIMQPFGRFDLSPEELLVICETSSDFTGYNTLAQQDQVNETKGGKYVTGIIMDVLRGGQVRNMRLNPRRGDQSLVYIGGDQWEARSFLDATSQLCTAATSVIYTMSLEHCMDILQKVAGGITSVHFLYNQNPVRYNREIAAPLTVLLEGNPQTFRQRKIDGAPAHVPLPDRPPRPGAGAPGLPHVP